VQITMSQAILEDPSIRTNDASSKDPSIAPDDSSTLQKRPRRRLLSKLIRSAGVAAGEELLASWLAHDRGKHGSYMTSRVPKMALYGAFISTSLTHFLLKGLRALFDGQESSTARVLEILVGMLVVAPIQKIVHIVSMALFAGARTFFQIGATIRAVLLPTMTVIWFAVPLAVAFAQNFLPENLWPQFFGLMSFVVNTYANAMLKKKRLAALRKRHYGVASKLSNPQSSMPQSSRPQSSRPQY